MRSLLFANERVDAETGVAIGYAFSFVAMPAIVATAIAWLLTRVALAYAWVAAVALGSIGLKMPMGVFTSCLVATLLVVSLAAVRGGLVMATSRYMLTSQRLIARTGILRRRTQQIELRRISGFDVRQSLLGRLLRYGNVSVRCGNVPRAVEMRFVPDPRAWEARLRGACVAGHVPVTAAFDNVPA